MKSQICLNGKNVFHVFIKKFYSGGIILIDAKNCYNNKLNMKMNGKKLIVT